MLAFVTQSLKKISLLQSKQSWFLCGNFIPSNVFVQSVENLPDTVFFPDNDIKSLSFIILCSKIYPLKLRLDEITL